MGKFFRFRSSVTGLFVTLAYAIMHPRITYRDMMQRRGERS